MFLFRADLSDFCQADPFTLETWKNNPCSRGGSHSDPVGMWAFSLERSYLGLPTGVKGFD